jgi:hypothetical protein
MVGAERELVLHRLFGEVLPPLYRFGQGAITDTCGSQTGQLDLVLELPFGLSLPLPAGAQRLYLAESVAAVFEVKSDLSTKWNDVLNSARKVRALKRDLRQVRKWVTEESADPHEALREFDQIGSYAIGFRGFKSSSALQKRLTESPPADRPHGALVIESGAFVGLTGSADGEEGFFGFIAEVVALVNNFLGIAYPSFEHYAHTAANTADRADGKRRRRSSA